MTTIILLVSREFLLDQIFERLNHLICDPTDTNLLVMVDGDGKLYTKARNLVTRSKFSTRLCVKAPIGKVSPSQIYRRKRIALLHNEAKQYLLPSEYVLLLEDDGLFPIDILERLLGHYKEHPDAGFISALELGRWLTPYVGGWWVDNPANPSDIQSIDATGKLEEVHAAGFYGMLTKHYEDLEFEFHRNYGPDLNWGFKLSSLGYKNYMDTSLVIDHYRQNGTMVNLKNTVPKTTHMKLSRGIWRFVNKVQH